MPTTRTSATPDSPETSADLVARSAATGGGAPAGIAATRLLAARGREALAQDRLVVAGSDGWLFLSAELAALDHAPELVGDTSPVEVIADFRDQLARAGIRLLVVPVPARSAILATRLAAPGTAAPQDLVTPLDAVLPALAERGVEALDLRPAFAARAAGSEPQPYCRSDSHWSGSGIRIAAEAIAGLVAGSPWLGEVTRVDLSEERRLTLVSGDLIRDAPAPAPEPESLELDFVGRAATSPLEPVAPSRDSPLLLLGDSHVLVFHAGGDLHATGAGLADQLAFRLGFALDVLGVRGSGATPARVSLARRGARGLEGKKLVVWVFAERELDPKTGAAWKKIAVVP